MSVVVDGETDRCSKGEDINFQLLGFSVYGQVSGLKVFDNKFFQVVLLPLRLPWLTVHAVLECNLYCVTVCVCYACNGSLCALYPPGLVLTILNTDRVS